MPSVIGNNIISALRTFLLENLSIWTHHWVINSKRYKVAQGTCLHQSLMQGSLVANNSLDLFCMNLTKTEPSKDGKENVLVITDTFSKFTIAIVTPSQKIQTVAEVPVDMRSYTYGIPS